MDLKRDLLWGVGALVAILLLVCLGSIGLYMRMSPAIEHVLQENDVSLQATEQMLAVLADDDRSPVATSRFREALAQVKANVTEPEEQPEIEKLDALQEAALAGDERARGQAVEALLRLARINRAAMHRANEDVQRLGWAGAWATAILCLLGFVAAIVVTRRIDRRIANPLAELGAALSAALSGDVYRRCTHLDAQADVRLLMESFNQLLDRCAAPPGPSDEGEELGWKPAAIRLLEELSGPVVLLDATGRVAGANQSGLERVGGLQTRQWQDARKRAVAGEAAAPVERVDRLDGPLWLCRLSDEEEQQRPLQPA